MFQMRQEDLNEYRAFCRNEMGVYVDADGGIVEWSLIDCYHHHDGMVYPDEIKFPILSRDHASKQKYAAYGAAVQLYTREKTRRVLLHRPGDMTFSLSYLEGGDEAQSYKLLLDNDRLLWECECFSEEREDLLFCINRRFLFNGTVTTHKEQHQGARSTQEGDHFEEAGIPLPPSIPGLRGPVNVTWTEGEWCERERVLLIRGAAEYGYGTTSYVIACGMDAPTVREEAPGMTVLKATWEDRRAIRVGMALAHSDEEAIAALRDGLGNFETLRAARMEEEKINHANANAVATAALPFAEDYGKAAADYLESLLVGPMNGRRVGVRASAGKYGYFSLWDAIFPLRDFLWNGRYEDVAHALRYLFNVPAMENTPVPSVHLIAAWNEAMAFLPEGLLEDMYPNICRLFDFEVRLTEPRYGLLQCKGNTGVDHADQMGFHGLFLSADVNGLWYNAVCAVHNEALRHGDTERAKQAERIIKGMDEGFRKALFNEKVGYFHVGVNADFTPADFEIYHNTLTLGYDYAYGPYLMRGFANDLAHYQSHELWHPLGHRAVAFDSAIPCPWWRYVHMNQHNGHEMKLQRNADDMAEVYRVMGQVMARSDRWKNAEETTNFSRFAIHPDQVCDWQSFAATAQMEALRSAVAGLGRHRGGLYYMPATDKETVTVRNIPVGNERIAFTAAGDGSFGRLYCGDREIVGSLQVPADVCVADLRIERCEQPAHPVLLSAVDLPVREVAVSGGTLSFVCDATVFSPITWYAPCAPTVYVGGEAAEVEWNAEAQRAYVARVWQAGQHVTVSV